MIKNIVFDIGKVLVKYDPNVFASYYTNQRNEQEEIVNKIFYSEEYIQLDQGTMTLEEVIEILQKRVSSCVEPLVRKVISTYYTHFELMEGIEDIIRRLKQKGYQIYALSNAPTYLHDFVKNFPIFQYFNGYILSGDYKILKPDRRLYMVLSDKYHLDPNECCFIDDKQINVEAAINLGMQGFVFRDSNHLLKELRNKGIL